MYVVENSLAAIKLLIKTNSNARISDLKKLFKKYMQKQNSGCTFAQTFTYATSTGFPGCTLIT